MTRRMLLGVAELRLSLWEVVGVYGMVGLLLPLTLLYDGIQGYLLRQKHREVLSWAEVRCPAGDRVPLHGAFTCPSCHLVFEGHGFGACSHCGAYVAAIGCACGRTIRNPLWVPEEG